MVYGKPVEHDIKACNALKEYDNYKGIHTSKLINSIAKKYGTTVENMKNHWICIEQEELTKNQLK